MAPRTRKAAPMEETPRRPLVNFFSALRTPLRSLVRLYRRITGKGGVAWVYLKSGQVVRFRANNVKWVKTGSRRELTWDTPRNARLELVAIPDLNEVVAVVVN